MKRLISLLVCLTAVAQGANAANIAEQPDNTKHFSTENLVRQSKLEDYKKYIGGRLSANSTYSQPVTLFSAEVQTINIDEPDDYLKMKSPRAKHEKRKFYFNQVQAMVYKPQIIKKERPDSYTAYYEPYFERPIVASQIGGETFEIVDVIRFTELYEMLIPFNEMAKADFEANYAEVQNVKVKKKQLGADKEPKVFYRSAIPPIVLEIPEQDMPVFVLKDRSGKRCYWVPELTNENAYDMQEAMVLTSYVDYLRHEYAGKKYIYKGNGRSLSIDDFIVKNSSLYVKTSANNDPELYIRYAGSDKKIIIEDIKNGRLLTESQYADYLAEQERKKRREEEQKRLEEEKKQQERREAERQRQLEEQRKQQELVRKYGAHYAECIANHKVEIGMPLEVVEEMFELFWMYKVSTQVTQGLKVEVYKYLGTYYTFVNGKLTKYQY